MRPFYIIAHNPNTIPLAIQQLGKGANALEPDISYVNETNRKDYVVFDEDLGKTKYSGYPTLKDYCSTLADKILSGEIAINNLALIAWDIKTSVAEKENFQELFAIIQTNLIDKIAEKNYSIPMLFTRPSDTDYLTKCVQPIIQPFENMALGTDEKWSVDETYNSLKSSKRYSYGYGFSFWIFPLSILSILFFRIQKAIMKRDKQPDGFKFVYA
jgi:hypothetical protein